MTKPEVLVRLSKGISRISEFISRVKEDNDLQSMIFLIVGFPLFVIFVFANLTSSEANTVLLNGFLNGSTLALMALGFSIIFGIARMFKLSIGGYFVLGAFIAFWLISAINLNINGILEAPINSFTILQLKLIIFFPYLIFLVGIGYLGKVLGPLKGGYFAIFNIIAFIIQRNLVVKNYQIFDYSRFFLGKASFYAMFIQGSIVLLTLGLFYFELSERQLLSFFTVTNLLLIYSNLSSSINIFNELNLFRSPAIYFAVIIYSILFVSLISMMIDRYLLDEIRHSPTNILIVTFGIALLIQSVLAEVKYPVNREFVAFGIEDYALNGLVPKGDSEIIFNAPIQTLKIIAMFAAMVLIILVILFLKYTPMGLAMQAVSQDEDAAWLMGINVRKVYVVTTGLGMGLAAAAGVLISPYEARPSWGLIMGWFPLILAIAVVTLGGLGSVRGSVIAGFIIGFTQSYVSLTDPTNVIIVPFIVILITMLVRPEGLFGIPEAEE